MGFASTVAFGQIPCRNVTVPMESLGISVNSSMNVKTAAL